MEGAHFWTAEYFVSHTLPDTPFCRELILPTIESLVERNFNQYVFMNLENFGRSSIDDGKNAEVLAKAYSKEIDRLLADSRYFLLVASRASLISPWVHREVSWWLANRRRDQVFVVYKEICDVALLHTEAEECTSFAPSSDLDNEIPKLANALRVFQSRWNRQHDA